MKTHVGALRNAGNTFHRKCPYWRCTARVTLDTIVEHLLTHNAEEFSDMDAQLRPEGYVPVREACAHGGTSETEDSGMNMVAGSQTGLPCTCTVVGINVICPICHRLLQDHDTFEEHFKCDHMLLQAEKRIQFYIKNAGEILFDSMFVWLMKDALNYVRLEEGNGCQYCMSVSDGSENYQEHSCWMRPKEELVAELRPVRREILRLFPEFRLFTFVFEDLF